MKKPNLLYQITLGSLLKLVTIFKGQKIVKKMKIKGPAIVLSNHTSFYDFMYTFSAIYPRRTNFVAARKMFHEKTLKTFMKVSRSIPKSLMESDITSVKSILQILKKDGIITIFPEGQISPSGATMNFNLAINKLLKKANVNVYVVKHFGAGLVNPAWSKKTFKGKIETKTSLLFPANSLKDLSLDEISLKVKEALKYRPSEFVRETNYKYHVNKINNLENLFYLCQNCQHEGLEVVNNHLHCPNCEANYHYTNEGFINETPYDEFFYNQQQLVEKEIKETKDFSLSASCDLYSIKDNKMQIVGNGLISVNKDFYTYVGTIDNLEVTKTFDVKNVSLLPSDIGRNIQIYDKEQVYQFELNNQYLPTKFVHVADYFHRIKKSEI